ncbi:MAG: MBL fold metallo-hydrolase [Candidatus Bathyarchaeia archaeon]
MEGLVNIPDAMSIRFLGGTDEVGRSALAVRGGGTQILLDYGVLMDREPGFPMHVPANDVSGIVLTHAHLDHSGAIPIFHIRGHIPVYATRLTAELSRLLIADFIHLSGYYLPYEFLDLETMMESCVYVDYRTPSRVGELEFQLFESGHIPGGALCLVEYKGRRLLYTSDFNTLPTRLLRGADLDVGRVDCLIMEATYADQDHADRKKMEERFVDRANEIVESGGIVLVPAFSVGRSQEILCILAAHNFEHNVTLDGMAEDASEIMMSNLGFIKDPRLFMDAMHMANWVRGWKDRRKAVKKPGIIVSPAGMLKGGNALFYMNSVARSKMNAIFLVSYQVPESPGRSLLETRRFIIGGKMRQVGAVVEHYEFSSHCGKTQLLEAARLLGKDAKIFVMHGAEGNCTRLAEEIKKKVGIDAVVPRAGESFQV